MIAIKAKHMKERNAKLRPHLNEILEVWILSSWSDMDRKGQKYGSKWRQIFASGMEPVLVHHGTFETKEHCIKKRSVHDVTREYLSLPCDAEGLRFILQPGPVHASLDIPSTRGALSLAMTGHTCTPERGQGRKRKKSEVQQPGAVVTAAVEPGCQPRTRLRRTNAPGSALAAQPSQHSASASQGFQPCEGANQGITFLTRSVGIC